MPRASTDNSRAALRARLQSRRAEIEQAALARVSAITDDPADVGVASEAESIEGLRTAIAAALDYVLAGLQWGEERAPPPPAALVAQARIAPRVGISLDTLLRRYFAGHTLFCDFLIEEAQAEGPLVGTELQLQLRAQATLCDRLLATASDEYRREASRLRLRPSSRQHRFERIRRLLAGELLDTSGFSYDFEAHHLSILASGPEVSEMLGPFAKSLDRRLLIVQPDHQTCWAWLGGHRKFDPSELELFASFAWPDQVALACGEPAQGLVGWRITHQQAKAALSVALRGQAGVVRYAEVALLAAVLQDDLLARSLRELYLTPLSRERDGGRTARATLRAYFAADRNVSSAAAALGIKRHTVTSRLRAIEERIGRPLSVCASEVDAALRMEELGASSSHQAAASA